MMKKIPHHMLRPRHYEPPKPHEGYKRRLILIVLGLFVGMLIGGWTLVFKPVRLANSLSAEYFNDHRHVYFLPGQRATVSVWTTMRRQFLSAIEGKIITDEEQLNLWARNLFTLVSGRAIGINGIFAWARSGDVNFRIENNEFQIAQPLWINVGGTGGATLYQARGYFEIKEGRYYFMPQESTLGSFPLPFSKLFFYWAILPLFDNTPEFQRIFQQWNIIKKIDVNANVLEVTL